MEWTAKRKSILISHRFGWTATRTLVLMMCFLFKKKDTYVFVSLLLLFVRSRRPPTSPGGDTSYPLPLLAYYRYLSFLNISISLSFSALILCSVSGSFTCLSFMYRISVPLDTLNIRGSLYLFSLLYFLLGFSLSLSSCVVYVMLFYYFSKCRFVSLLLCLFWLVFLFTLHLFHFYFLCVLNFLIRHNHLLFCCVFWYDIDFFFYSFVSFYTIFY